MIWLANYNVARLALQYDPATGEAVEIQSDQAGPRARGFYVNSGDSFVGTYASLDGPVFFVDRDRYLMTDPTFSVEHHHGTSEHRFVARCAGKAVFDLRYPPRTDWGYDNWTAEEADADWFLQLTHSVKRDQFYRYYTAPFNAPVVPK